MTPNSSCLNGVNGLGMTPVVPGNVIAIILPVKLPQEKRHLNHALTPTDSEYEFQNGGSGDSSSVPRTVPAAQNVEQMPNSSQRLKQQSYSFSMQSDDEMPIASEYSPREDWTTRSTHSRNNISNLAEFPTSYTEPVNYTTNGSAKSSFEPDYINVYGSMPQRSESAPLTSNVSILECNLAGDRRISYN